MPEPGTTEALQSTYGRGRIVVALYEETDRYAVLVDGVTISLDQSLPDAWATVQAFLALQAAGVPIEHRPGAAPVAGEGR